MSEPAAALLKLRMARADLIAWLAAPPPSVTAWSDWREIGGKWQFGEGRALRDLADSELAETLAECDDDLEKFATNRAALRSVLDTAEAPALKRAAFDEPTREFLAASLTYAETIVPIIAFFALARSAADHLGPDGYGVALVHHYLFAGPNDDTLAAMRLGPGGESSFLVEGERGSATGAFDAVAAAMTADGAPVIDRLDGLR